MPDTGEWGDIAGICGWSERECEVVRRVLAGEARRRGARSMRITQSTLQTYLRRALWKADARDVIQLLWRVIAIRDTLRR